MQGTGWLNRLTAQPAGWASCGCPKGDANATAFASPQPEGQAPSRAVCGIAALAHR